MSSKIREESDKPVLILGHPRSGTNFLSSIVRTHPDVSLLIEPFGQHSEFVRNSTLRYWDEDDYDRVFMHKDLVGSPSSSRYFCGFRDWLMSGDGVKSFKETTFFLKLKWLKKYLPGVRVLYTFRDPRGIVSSFKRANLFEEWGYRKKFRTLQSEARRRDELDRYEEIIEHTDTNSWIDMLTTIWYVRTSEAKEKIDLFDARLVNYEDLAEDPHTGFQEVFDYLDFEMGEYTKDVIEERCSVTKGGIYSTFRDSFTVSQRWRKDLNNHEKWLVEDKTMELAGEYGYTK